ncbi:MAG: CDP-glucose 4,6-dehydratase [Planctomycetota bacterium]|jgi:CDP-glucose 4,6-dehydratase
MVTPPFAGAFAGRRVLVTGHTGFKGSWLSEWLLGLGAEVHGLALAPDTTPSLFAILGLERRLASHRIVDVRDGAAVAATVAAVRPEVVLHLAAQPLVRLSYREPAATWATNVQGTVHLLEALRAVPGCRACVVVTSDKCYENREQVWGYRESDAMGGHDPYSSSKGAAELAVASWRRSFFSTPDAMRLASGRAGNVIGGGDWSADRIVVDFVAAIAAGRTLHLRNPLATRPWQHVLEPLSGYLWLAARLLGGDGARFADGWNFGPADASVTTVKELADRLVAAWGSGSVACAGNAGQPHEAGLLKLDVSKAAAHLGWRGIWDVSRTAAETVAWYRSHHLGGADLADLTRRQIAAYTADARAAGLAWTR